MVAPFGSLGYSFRMHTILPEKDNPALRSISRDIPHAQIKGPKIKKTIAEMKRLLAKEEFGVALAAVQLGEPVRLFIVSGKALARGARNASDLPAQAGEPEPNLPAGSSNLEPVPDLVFINPQLLKVSRKKMDKHEGCLSIRGKWGEVPRAEKVTLQYTDEQGHKTQRGASGFLAHIFQHEMDHLEGILYTDKTTALYDESDKK